MFYTYSYTPTADDVEATPHEIDMYLPAGVIHQVDVLFQDGCKHEEFVQICQANLQLWPTNRGATLQGNASVTSFRDFHELESGNSVLTAKFWSTLTDSWTEVLIQIGILPRKVLQPLSFDELFKAATGQ